MDSLMTGLAFFQKGGFAMYLILLCSFVVLGIAIERFTFYRKMQPKQRDFSEQAKALIATEDWSKLVTLCQSSDGIVARVLAKIVVYRKERLEVYKELMEGEITLAVAKLGENLNHLESIVTVAPLLGLLGTVLGMIHSFSVLNLKSGQPLAITGGVGEALIATAAGLCVAIVSMFCYSYFSHRLDRILTEFQEFSLLLLAKRTEGDCHENS